MARTKISEFSATPANNTDIDSINIAENCPPSGINDAIRELMAQLKDFQTGAVGDSFNGPVGTTTAAAGAFTTLSASSTVSGTGFSTYLASPPAIGGTAAAAGSFTTLSASGNVTLSGGTANGVAYLNGSKVVTSGSALTFDGSTLTSGASGTSSKLVLQGGNQTAMSIKSSTGTGGFLLGRGFASDDANSFFLYDLAASQNRFYIDTTPNIFQYATAFAWSNAANSTEYMRLTSTGLGIGTSSPSEKLEVVGNYIKVTGTTNQVALRATNTGGDAYFGIDNSVGSNFNTGTAYAGVVWRSGANPICFVNNSSEKMRLDSSGNLGLGVTPSAWGSTYRAMQVGLTSSLVGLTNDTRTHLSTNAFFDGTNWKYIATSPAARYSQIDNVHQWFNAPSGTAGNAITFTQAATLNANGDFGVGTTSPENYKQFGYGATIEASGGAGGSLIASSSSKTIIALLSCDTALGVATLKTNTNHPLAFFTNNTERARIDSSGVLLIGKTSANEAAQGMIFNGSTGLTVITRDGGDPLSLRRTSNDGAIVSFRRDSTLVGSISVTTTATAYNTSSDYRLKNTIAPMTGALAKVALLKPCTYKWNADGSDGEGFIAHELAEVVPQCVTGEKDAVDEDGNPKYQGIDTSFLVATLTAALQELNAKFDAYVASHP